MKKQTKIVFIGISVFLALLCIATLWFLFPEWSYLNSDIEKVYCTATLEDDFADDTILIVLTNEASLESVYHDFTPDDFALIGCAEVRDLSTGITADIRSGEETNTTNYRRILSLKLGNPGKLNVLLAIKILEHRPDVRSATPNHKMKADL